MNTDCSSESAKKGAFGIFGSMIKTVYASTNRKKRKYEAEQYAQQFLLLSKSPKPIRLDEYANDYYVWDKCDWIKRKLAK